MTLNLNRSAWRKVRFGDVVRQVKASTDPVADGVKRYVAGEHMDSDSLSITRWGMVGDGYLGPAFHRQFKSGQVLYGSRRTYLRKVAVADFDGVCANTTFVMESADPTGLLPDLLPFVMSTEAFHAHSVAESKGSVNPYVNWPDIAKFEFDLPPLDEQRKLAALLWSVESQRARISELRGAISLASSAFVDSVLADFSRSGHVRPLEDLIEAGRPITYGILKPGPSQPKGVPVIKVKDYPQGFIDEGDLLLTTAAIDESYKRSRLRQGDLLISIRGTVGRLAEVPKSLNGANITQDSARLSIDPQHSTSYVRLALESNEVQALISRAVTGLAVKGINIGELRKVPIPIPPSKEAQEHLVAMAAPYDSGRQVVGAELKSLSELRQAILAELDGWSP